MKGADKEKNRAIPLRCKTWKFLIPYYHGVNGKQKKNCLKGTKKNLFTCDEQSITMITSNDVLLFQCLSRLHVSRLWKSLTDSLFICKSLKICHFNILELTQQQQQQQR